MHLLLNGAGIECSDGEVTPAHSAHIMPSPASATIPGQGAGDATLLSFAPCTLLTFRLDITGVLDLSFHWVCRIRLPLLVWLLSSSSPAVHCQLYLAVW